MLLVCLFWLPWRRKGTEELFCWDHGIKVRVALGDWLWVCRTQRALQRLDHSPQRADPGVCVYNTGMEVGVGVLTPTKAVKWVNWKTEIWIVILSLYICMTFHWPGFPFLPLDGLTWIVSKVLFLVFRFWLHPSSVGHSLGWARWRLYLSFPRRPSPPGPLSPDCSVQPWPEPHSHTSLPTARWGTPFQSQQAPRSFSPFLPPTHLQPPRGGCWFSALNFQA